MESKVRSSDSSSFGCYLNNYEDSKNLELVKVNAIIEVVYQACVKGSGMGTVVGKDSAIGY